MNVDFHYGVIYVVCRLASLDRSEATTVAHACQYIDDSTKTGILDFHDGQTFDRFASAHKMFDYENQENSTNKLVWVPFHFLPGGQGKTLEEKAICRPNSEIAKQMVRHALKCHDAENSLHRLGVTLHVYVDTWAHQGFSGIRSDYNKIHHLEGDEHDAETWLGKLKNFLKVSEDSAQEEIVDLVSGLGHGAALHFPRETIFPILSKLQTWPAKWYKPTKPKQITLKIKQVCQSNQRKISSQSC